MCKDLVQMVDTALGFNLQTIIVLDLHSDGTIWGIFFRGYETGLGFHTYETGMKPV